MKIFISSTAYDLADFRDLTIDRLKKRGHEVVYHENGTFPVHSGFHSHDECILAIQDCDIVICIVDRRYGGKFSGVLKNNFKDIELTVNVNVDEYITKDGKTYPISVKTEYPIKVAKEDLSITWCEIITAIEKKIDVVTFVRDRTLNEKQTRRVNQNIKHFKPAYAEKNELFDFLDWITKLDKSNWIIEYSKIVDFEEKLISWIAEKEKQKVISKTNKIAKTIADKPVDINNLLLESAFNFDQLLRVAIILEGEMDREIIKFIVERMSLYLKIDIFSMGGKTMITNNINEIISSYSIEYDYVIIIVDSDNWNIENANASQIGNIHNSSLIYAVPEIEFWLLAGIDSNRYMLYKNEFTTRPRINKKELRKLMYEKFDISTAATISQDFKSFIELLNSLSSQKSDI